MQKGIGGFGPLLHLWQLVDSSHFAALGSRQGYRLGDASHTPTHPFPSKQSITHRVINSKCEVLIMMPRLTLDG
jgi:hypothetical protein